VAIAKSVQRVLEEPTAGKLSTLAGCGKRGKFGLGVLALEAQLTDHHGVNIRPDGSLIFADSFNYRVVKVEP
jgi:hypothetical protein